MLKYIFIVSLFVLVLSSCSTQKKQAELLEQSKPAWLKERPVNSNYYYGIGVTPKIGAPALFEDKAKERALADISGQINSTIKAEAIFYQVEDRQGVHEYLQNRIKSQSTQYLEGYEYVEKWEDLSNVYAFYRLSKQKYQEVKERRKREAFGLAAEKYQEAIRLKNEGKHIEAITHWANVIDAISGYLNASTTTDINGQSVDLVSASTKEMSNMLHLLEWQSHSRSLHPSNYFTLLDERGNKVANFPVRMKYSGGYLVNDKVKTDVQGKVDMPELNNQSNTTKQTLKVAVDLVQLGRQVTRNLYVRSIIEKQKAVSIIVEK